VAELLATWCFKGTEKVVFWFVSVFGLFCRLLQMDIGELVSVMKHNPNCLMKILYELCEL
jgi:hypothetical protein